MNVQISLLSKNAQVPTFANDGDAGYDLYAAEDKVIFPLGWTLIKTDIALAIPNGYYGQIAPRSGLALKSGITVFGGIIDSTYRGNVGVILYNAKNPYEIIDKSASIYKPNQKDVVLNQITLNSSIFRVSKGDRVAQIIFKKYEKVGFDLVDKLPESDRGQGGFGSTGV